MYVMSQDNRLYGFYLPVSEVGLRRGVIILGSMGGWLFFGLMVRLYST